MGERNSFFSSLVQAAQAIFFTRSPAIKNIAENAELRLLFLLIGSGNLQISQLDLMKTE
jgi:hypothetical protein